MGEDKEHCDISRLKISPAIRKHSATKPVEILKRATARKNKVLFMFPGLVSVVQEGKFGQLSDMDSNPQLDVDFPTGKLRMMGTHLHTKTKLMTLQPAKGGKRMQAQDFFDHVVVFSQHEWIGHPDQDPTKDIPEEAFKVMHKDVSYSGGAAAASQASTGGTPSIKNFMVVEDAGVEATAGRARRAATQKVKYRDDGSDGSGGDYEEEEEEEEATAGTRSPVRLPVATEELTAAIKAASPVKRTKPSGSAPSAAKQGQGSTSKPPKNKKADDSDIEEIIDDDDDDDDDDAPVVARESTSRRASAQKVKSYVIKDSDSDDDDDEGDEEEEDDAPPPKAAAPKKAPAKSAGGSVKKAPSKKRRKGDSDEEEEEEEDDDSDSSEAKPPAKKKAASGKGSAKKPAAKKPAPKKKPQVCKFWWQF